MSKKNEEIENKLIDIVLDVAKTVYPFIGLGNAEEMDIIATEKYSSLLDIWPSKNINTIAIEGERDGVVNTRIQLTQENYSVSSSQILLALDPIDGTRTAAAGGSRAVTIIAVSLNPQNNYGYKVLPDTLSCFYAASNESEQFLTNIRNLKRSSIVESNVSTLRRSESYELWSYLLDAPHFHGIEGERTCYMPNMIYENVFFAGDTSVTLFLESQHFLGRTGVTEARIESRLWKYWLGFLVSGNKIKKYSGGALNYFLDIIQAIKSGSYQLVNQFFEESELQELYNLGWTDEEILQLQTPDKFSPPYDIIIIGSLTGTYDSVFTTHSARNLTAMSYESGNDSYNVPMYIRNRTGERIVNKKILC